MRESSHPSKRTWHPLIAPAIEAFTAYWPAILFIQLVALGVVLSYYLIEGTAGLFTTLANWKVTGGLYFSASTTVISGGVLPELIKRQFRAAGMAAPSAGELCHQFMMWAVLGIMVDIFYRVQNALFGEGTDALTLLIKIIVDQGIFAPFICLPFITLWFVLREVDYAPKAFLAFIRFKKIRNRVLPLWATGLCFWPIMLCIIFSLPAPLQFPLFLLGNTAYSILMIFIIRRQAVALP